MFSAAKDLLTSQAARSYVNGLIKRYGVVSELKIDSRSRTVEVTCELEGENDPVNVRIENYSLNNEGSKTFIVVGACTCSRPWLQNLLEDHACGRPHEIPGWAAAML